MTKGANPIRHGNKNNNPQPMVRDDPDINPNSLHDFHTRKRGPRNVPNIVKMTPTTNNNSSLPPKDPGHPYAKTQHISFDFFDQRTSNAPFGYEHYISLPPTYTSSPTKSWPLILFLHGAGESQRGTHESYASIRHGIPKIILCYDKLKSNQEPAISIPLPPRLRKSTHRAQEDKSLDPIPPQICEIVAENFITVTPSLNMEYGYGWNASILSALLDEIVERYRIDLDRIHLTGFSMGGYGTWSLALQTPNRFASLMPICGGGDSVRASQISQIPHWIHHGDLDDIIPLRASQQMVSALKKHSTAKAGDLESENEERIKFTRYPDLMHDSWSAAYGDIEVWKWMLKHKRERGGDEKGVREENLNVVVGGGDE